MASTEPRPLYPLLVDEELGAAGDGIDMAEQHQFFIAVAARRDHRTRAVQMGGLPAEAGQAVREHPRRVLLVSGGAGHGDDVDEKPD